MLRTRGTGRSGWGVKSEQNTVRSDLYDIDRNGVAQRLLSSRTRPSNFAFANGGICSTSESRRLRRRPEPLQASECLNLFFEDRMLPEKLIHCNGR